MIKNIKKINTYTIICWYVLLFTTSCSSFGNTSLTSISQNEKHYDNGDTLKGTFPNIFNKSNEQICNEINDLLRKSPDLYESFIKHFVQLNLYCDTVDCSIQEVDIEYNNGFDEISNKLVTYFKTLDPVINCKHQYKNIRISHFELLILAKEDGLTFTVGYGYRTE